MTKRTQQSAWTRAAQVWAALLLCGCGSATGEEALHNGSACAGAGCEATALPGSAAVSGGAEATGAPVTATSGRGSVAAVAQSAGMSGQAGALGAATSGAGTGGVLAANAALAGQVAAASGSAGASGAAAMASAAAGAQSASGSGGNAGASAAGAAAQATRRLPSGALALRFADAVLARWPNPADIAPAPSWEYNHGIVLRGIEQVYKRSGDERYLHYLQRFVDASVSSTGSLSLPSEHSFDDIQPAVFLPMLFEATGQDKYKTAAASVRAYYTKIPRNKDGGFWHKQRYPNQMWLDSIYMGEPFLARYGRVFDCDAFCFDTVSEQVQLLAAHVQDSATGLLYHAWDDSPSGQKAAWADASSGRSPAVWGRGLGWFAMALVDLLNDLPSDHAGRPRMLELLTQLAAGLQRAQDAQSGMWYQVVDQGDRSDNWLETSGSGMFVYALKVGVDSGYLDASYLTVARHGFEGLQKQVSESNQMPSIHNAVQGMGVQNNYAGYVNQSKVTDSPHGLCAILLAASEMEAQ